MSDELDRFVLQYQIDSGTAERDLARLNSKVKAMSADSDKSTGSVNDLGAAMRSGKGHGDSFAGALDQVFTKLRNISPGAVAATTAMAGLAAIMAQVNKSMREYSEQRELAFRTGTGVVQVEQFQRNVSAASKGRIDAVGARDIYKTVNDLGQAAFTDPYQNNREARLLRSAGGRVNGDDGRIASVDENIESISRAFAALDESSAKAKGALLGFSQDQTLALRELGKASAQNKNLSDAEVASHAQATAAALRLQGAQGEVSEAFRRTGNAVADMAMGPLTTFEEHIAKIAQKLPGAVESIGGRLDWLDRFISNLDGKLDHSDSASNHMSVKEAADKADRDQKAAAEKARDEQKKQNAQTRAEVTQTNRDINLFSQAVSTFAGSIDQSKALASWAGELGRSSGLGSKDGFNLGDGPRGRAPSEDSKARTSITGETSQPGGGNAQPGVSRGIRNNNPGNLESGPFTKALGAIGSDGRFATFKTMADGIAAHERLIQNYRKDGFDTIKKIISKYAPSSENDTVGYYKSVAKEVGIDPNAKITDDKMPALLAAMRKRESGYRGENVAPRLQPQGDDYSPSAVQQYAMNPNAAPVYRDFEPTGLAWRKQVDANGNRLGIGRQHDQAIASADELAGAIPGATREQILQGGISRGDIRYAESNLYAGHVTSMLQADAKLNAPGLTPAQRQELFEQRGTAAARVRDDRNFYGDFAQRAPEGPRTSLTIGSMPVTIQASDFTPEHVSRVLNDALKQTVNSFASDRKL